LTALNITRVNPFDVAMDFLRTNPLLTTFLSLAIAFRILFQAVTQRTWEDALILDFVTQNLWLGHGLTHQTSESPIQSFSSVVWMCFSLIGNSVGQGVLFLKLISLLATVATLWFVYLIALRWRINKPGIILILGFLSFEQIHVTFGMAGMESQFATAFVLMGIWALVEQRPVVLMLTATTAPLVRPELVFWSLLVVMIYFLRPRLITVRAIAISVTPLILWLFFATFYFGTFIPQTVTAKSLIGTTNVSKSGLLNGVTASLDSWERFTPYFSNYFATSGLIPRSIGMWIVIALAALFLAGVFRITRLSYIWAVPALLVPLFILYVGFFNVSNYHMWYVPPFSAILILYAGAAFNLFPKVFVPIKYFISCGIVFLYLIPTVSYFQHDAYVQKQIDVGVRQAAGMQLNALMNSDQSVILEPLGFLGSEVTSGDIIDYPGLASRRMTSSLELIPLGERNMGSAVRAILPDFVIVRQGEWQGFNPSDHPELADYKLLAVIGKPFDGDLVFTGATYSNSDRYFEIYGR
jgi:hypothetical protein